MSSKLLIRFIMKEKGKAIAQNKKTSLHCSITLNKKRASYDFATDVKVFASQWLAKSQIIKCKEAKTLNDRLDFIRSEMIRTYNHLLHISSDFSANDLINTYLGKNEKRITLLDMYDKLLDKLKNEKKAEGTVARFAYEKKRLEKFLATIKETAIEISKIDVAFCKDYHAYLIDFGTEEYATRKTETIKRIVLLAIDQGYLKTDPLQYYKQARKRSYKTPEYLTEAEIFLIENTAFSADVLQITADLFVFQCYTGFSYADLMSFDLEKHTLKEKDNSIWISKLRVKSENKDSFELAELPLFPQAQRILNKYKGVLPRLRNDHYNNYLKQIAEILTIKKRLHTHLARKTAGDRWLNAGVSLEVVAKMLGHQSTTTTSRHYAKVRRERVSLEVSKFYG